MLFHIVAARDYRPDAASYGGDTLEREGFIHCSLAEQLIQVAHRFFRGQDGLIVLVIDPAAVRAKIVYENLEGGDERFPHIYGPLNTDAVVTTFRLIPGADDSFSPPVELTRYRNSG